MPEEENKPAPAPVEGQGAGDGNGGIPSPAPKEGEGAPKPAEGENKAPEGDNKPAEAQKTDAPGDNDEPPVRPRKTAKDFIIERKERKIAKLQQQLQKKGDGADDADDDDNDGDDNSQNDKKFILETVEPILNPLIEKSLQQEDETEIQEFISKNPDFKPYEARARKFMQHPSRRQLPVKSIFYEVAGDDLLKIGAKRAAEADDKAKNGQSGGGSGRGGDAKPNAWAMSDKDFQTMQEQVRQKQR